MSYPLVSIIIPVYNIAPYLPACITSLAAQTYPSIEIIFVNDGSTDDSLSLLNAYQEQYPAVKIINKANAGLGAARNTGLDYATGEFVIFLDGDDWLAPETTEKCVAEAMLHNADLVCFGYQKVTREGNEIIEGPSFEYLPENYKADNDYIHSYFVEATPFPNRIVTTAWGKLYRRSLLEQSKIRFVLPIYEDASFVIEALFYSRTTRCIRGKYYYYLLRGNTATSLSITGNPVSEKKLINFFAADALVKQFLETKNCYHTYRSRFHTFHNARVLQYGGYFEVYVDANGANREQWPLFIDFLHQNRHGITWHRKHVYRGFRKRIVFLKIGAMLSVLSKKGAHRFFMWYEKTLAPK